MKFILFLVVTNFLVALVRADMCTLTNEKGDEIAWSNLGTNSLGSFEKTVQVGTLVPGLFVTNAKFSSVEASKNCDVSNFFDIASFNETYISATVKDDFLNWDSYKVGDTNGECRFTIIFDTPGCENVPDLQSSIRINFLYIVIDVNLSPPKFSSDSYKLTVPFPVGQGISLTDAFGVGISTTDTDFSTKAVTYTIEGGSDDFELTALPSSQKTFPVGLKTKKVVNLQKTLELTITATDDGSNPEPKSSKATLTIEADPENSIPPVPEFSESLFTEPIDLSKLNVGDSIPTSVTLKEAYDGVTLSLTPADLFDVTLNGVSVTLTLLKAIDPNGPAYQTLVLTATITNGKNSAKSSTVIILEFDDLDTTTDPSESTTDPSESTTDPSGSTTDPFESTTDPSGSTTDPSESTIDPSGSTTDPSGTTSGPTETPSDPSTTTTGEPNEPPPTPEPTVEEETDGLLISTIVLGVFVVILLGALFFGYNKFVRPKQKKIIPTSAGSKPSQSHLKAGGTSPTTTITTIENEIKPSAKLATKVEEGKNSGLTAPPEAEKTRKRSITFSDDDVESRVNREAGLSEVESSGNETESKEDSRSGSPNSEQDGLDNVAKSEGEENKVTSF